MAAHSGRYILQSQLPQFDLKKNGSIDACHREQDPVCFPSSRTFSFWGGEKGKKMDIQKANEKEQKERLKYYFGLIQEAEEKKEDTNNAHDEL